MSLYHVAQHPIVTTERYMDVLRVVQEYHGLPTNSARQKEI